MLSSWGDLYDANKRFPTSYPFTTTWKSNITATVNGINMVKGNNVTVPNTGDIDSDNTDYNAVLRTHVKSLLEDECNEIIRNTKFGKLKLDITFKAGVKDWILGERIEVTAPELFNDKKTLRITEIQYTTSTDMFSLEEDFGTI